MSNKSILFYSPKCQHSIELWKSLKDKNLLDNFAKVNVLTAGTLPKSITRTPTLIIQNRPPIVGQAIDFYLNSSTTVNKPQAQTQPQAQVPPTVENPGSIQDFNLCEMSSNWSDNYSFIDSKKPINHSYSFLNQTTEAIPQQPIGATESRKSAKSDEMQQRFDALKNARNNDTI